MPDEDARPHGDDPGDSFPPQFRIENMLGPLQAMSAQLAAVARAGWESAAAGTVPAPVVDVVKKSAEQLSSLPAMWLGPLQQILDEQRKMAALMTDWAQHHLELGRQMAAAAERHQQLTEQLAAGLQPIVESTERVSETIRSWTSSLGPRE